MGTIARTYGPATANPVATGSTILAAHVNTDLDTIYSEFNGNIENANVKSGAAIDISKTTLGTYAAWQAWVPTWTGFSAAPTVEARYLRIGALVAIHVTTTAAGTSNAISLTLNNLPAVANTTAYFCSARALDNGSSLTTPARIATGAGTAVLTITKDLAGAAWTNSGNKYCDIEIIYEAA